MTLERLAAPLKRILDAELEDGNTIQEIGEWPPKCQLLVLLRRPFGRPYDADPDVQYAEINDLHYWKAEYNYRGGVQTLACGFGG